MDYIVILLVIVILVVLFFMYKSLFPTKHKVATKIYLPLGIKPLEMDTLVASSSPIYTFDFWIYINSLPSTSIRDFNTNYGSQNSMNTTIMYTSDNNIAINLFQEGILTFFNGPNTTEKKHSIKSTFIPTQKWIYVIISVNNSFVDLYINGKLIESVNISKPNIPSRYSTLNFGNKLDVYIAGMNRTNHVMDTNTAYSEYKKGLKNLKDDNTFFNTIF
jgi:hypothetical protein